MAKKWEAGGAQQGPEGGRIAGSCVLSEKRARHLKLGKLLTLSHLKLRLRVVALENLWGGLGVDQHHCAQRQRGDER